MSLDRSLFTSRGKPVQLFTPTHRCTAPCSFPDTATLSWPAVMAYVEHHRTCQRCAASLGFSGRSCTPLDWYDPDVALLCSEGRRLFREWVTATVIEGRQAFQHTRPEMAKELE